MPAAGSRRVSPLCTAEGGLPKSLMRLRARCHVIPYGTAGALYGFIMPLALSLRLAAG